MAGVWSWWFGLEGESGLCEEAVDEVGPVLDVLEPVFHDGGQVVDAVGSEVAQLVLHIRPHSFGGVEVWCVGGEPHHGQPVRVRDDNSRILALMWVLRLSQQTMIGARSCWCVAVSRAA